MLRRSLGLGLLALGLVVGSAWAQEQTPAQGQHQRGMRGAGFGGPRGPRMSVDQQMEKLNKELQLTTEQQEKIKKLLDDHQKKMSEQREAFRAKMQANQTQMKELRTQLDAARKANDTEKVKELETKMRDLWGGGQMSQEREKLISGVEATLTPEQKAKFPKVRDEVFGPSGARSLESDPRALMDAVRGLNLPQDKSQKIRELYQDYRTKTQNQSDDERKTAAADLYKKVMGELTPEQQAKLKEARPAGPHDHSAATDNAQGRSRSSRSRNHGQPAQAPGTPQQ